MKRFLLLSLIIISCQDISYAANSSKVEVRGSINNGSATIEDSDIITKIFGTGALGISTISLGSSGTNLTIPSGAKAVLIDVGTNRSLHLKGVTGDRGITLDSTCPLLLPISSDGTTTINISPDGATTATITAWWF